MQYCVIINPAAGCGLVQKKMNFILEELRTAFRDAEIHHTRKPGHAMEIARGLKNSGSTIIAVGGDGTIHEIVNGMMGGDSRLGIVPVGSGNDFMKMLRLPLDIREAIKVIQRGKTKLIDVGMANDLYFPNGLGAGFDADVVIATQSIKHLRGFMMYLFSVLKALNKFRNHRVILSIDGKEEFREVFMITIGNGRCLGSNFYLTPRALIDDGLLDVCIFKKLKLHEVFRHLPKALKGTHIHLPQVEYKQARELSIQSETGIPVHADGELVSPAMKNLRIRVVPRALNVIHNLG